MEVVAVSTPGLGDMSYLLVHDGRVVVVDPQRDIDRFVAVAGDHDAEIRWVLETHLHNDYISGGKTLATRSGAELVLPAGAGAAFEYAPAFHNEDIRDGDLTVRPLHTPGHTPEHVSYLVLIEGEPAAVFSGGSLLVGAAGRTDLLGEDRARQLARLQWGSITRLATLPDETGLYPTHGAGSFCSASVAGPSTSTIGAERTTNPLLSLAGAEEFADHQLSGLEPYPRYYARMGPINLQGPPALAAQEVPELGAEEFERLMSGVEVVDGRPKDRYAHAHVPQAWGIEANQDFATWVGWLLPFDAPLALILDEGQDEEEARVALARIGFENVRGLMRGMEGWVGSGRAVAEHSTITARQFLSLSETGEPLQVLDVRSPAEWSDDHLDGSVHCYLPDLAAGSEPDLDPERPVYVGCTTGHRASTAAGILGRRGFRPVVMVGASLLGVLMLREQQRQVSPAG